MKCLLLLQKKSLLNGESSDDTSTESLNGVKKVKGGSLATLHEGDESRSGLNFIAEDFEGVSILQTTCLECECITEMKEAFCEIGVPITQPEDTNPGGYPTSRSDSPSMPFSLPYWISLYYRES